jgi:transcription initiation factor TFIIB
MESIIKKVRHLLVELDYKVPNTDPMKYIVRVANKLDLSEKIKRQAMSIMSEVTRNEQTDIKRELRLN